MYDITIINTLKVAINFIRSYVLILKKATLRSKTRKDMLDLDKLDKQFDELLSKWTSKKLDEWISKKDKEEQENKI